MTGIDLWPIITHLAAAWIGAAVDVLVMGICAINREDGGGNGQ